jgi:hypothetical protein
VSLLFWLRQLIRVAYNAFLRCTLFCSFSSFDCQALPFNVCHSF